jgi:hypothetical protein
MNEAYILLETCDRKLEALFYISSFPCHEFGAELDRKARRETELQPEAWRSK